MKKEILASFTILIIALIFTQVGIIPKYDQYKRLNNQRKGVQQSLEMKQKYYAQLFTTKAKLNQEQTAVSKVGMALPEKEDAPALYRFIQEKASENGLVLKGLGGLKISRSENASIGVIQFGGLVEGNYGALLSFLKSVEDSARLINVTSVTLLPEEKASANKKLKTTSLPRYALSLEANYFSDI